MEASVTTTVEWPLGGFVGLCLWFVLLLSYRFRYNVNPSRPLFTSAVGNELLIELGLSPVGDFATEISVLTPLLTASYSQFVTAFITVETSIWLFLGVFTLLEDAGILGLLAFICGFAGGTLLVYRTTIMPAVMLILIAWIAFEMGKELTSFRRL